MEDTNPTQASYFGDDNSQKVSQITDSTEFLVNYYRKIGSRRQLKTYCKAKVFCTWGVWH